MEDIYCRSIIRWGDPVWCLPLQRPGPRCAPGHLLEWGHTFSSSQSRVKRGREVVLGCKKTSPSLLMFMSHVNFTLKVEHPSVTQPNLRQILSGLSAKCAAIKCDGCVMMFSEWSSQSHTSHPPSGHNYAAQMVTRRVLTPWILLWNGLDQHMRLLN